MRTSQFFKPHYDVIIIGARCAGASTAMLLARAGMNVLVVDRQKYGSDITSTHALMRTGVLQLKRWGVLPKIMAAGTPAITMTTFHYGREEFPIDIKADHGVEFLCAPRRTVLDRILVDAAQEAGADVRHGISLIELMKSAGGSVTGVRLRDASGAIYDVSSDMVIGADGRQSLVARKVQAQTYVEGKSSSGYAYGYFKGPSRDGFHWYFGDDVTAGIIPTNDNRQCIFVGVPRDQFADTFRKNLVQGFHQIAGANSPELLATIREGRLDGKLRGFAGCPGYLKQSFGPGWCLVGDAGYFKDPMTAHGITDALRDAELLSHAVLEGTSGAFAEYQNTRDALSLTMFDVTDVISSFDWDINEIKNHHSRLSNAMKFEAEHMAGLSAHKNLAA